MKILKFVTILIFVNSFYSWGHEGEDLSPKLKPRFGGKLSAVIMEEDHQYLGKSTPSPDSSQKNDHRLHNDAKYIAEIIISAEKKVHLYLYDLGMKDLDLTNFPSEITMSVNYHGAQSRGPKFQTLKSGKSYIGELPQVEKKAFDIYVDFRVKKQTLHISFKNMEI